MSEELEALKREIADIKARNARVEADNAWETSAVRVTSIAAITYLAACFALYIIDAPAFYLGALIPAMGFILSTRTLTIIKYRWLRLRAEHAHD